MSEPKFGEWQPACNAPFRTKVLALFRSGGIWVHSFCDEAQLGAITHWMPLPAPPKEDWEEAWEKYKEDRVCTETWEIPAFKAGFEAGRKK